MAIKLDCRIFCCHSSCSKIWAEKNIENGKWLGVIVGGHLFPWYCFRMEMYLRMTWDSEIKGKIRALETLRSREKIYDSRIFIILSPARVVCLYNAFVRAECDMHSIIDEVVFFDFKMIRLGCCGIRT